MSDLCTADPTLLDRLGTRFTVGDGCWIWTGSHNRRYGQLHRKDGGSRVAHRIMYELLVGPIPEGMELDHLCRETFCVRPDHLEPVTHQENIRRGDSPAVQTARNAAVTHCVQGHEYTEENTYRNPTTRKRHCRVCMRELDRRRWKKNHE